MPFSIFAADAADHKKVKFHPRVLGSPAPMFPGYEVDISDHVDDDQKPDAVWHRDRAKQMIRNHPEIKKLFGNTPSTAIWCAAFFVLQVMLSWGVSQGPWWLMVLVAYFIYFNFGLHTEHHDIMGIPWHRLGKLRQIAPECYDNLVVTKSYFGLAVRFMFGDSKSLEQQFDNEDQRNQELLTMN